jgi:hypothetical protein
MTTINRCGTIPVCDGTPTRVTWAKATDLAGSRETTAGGGKQGAPGVLLCIDLLFVCPCGWPGRNMYTHTRI